MKIKQAIELKSIRRFKQATKTYMADWYEEFLRIGPAKKRTPANWWASFKAFAKRLKNALRKIQPEHATGLEQGSWRLPCGLTAQKAWRFLRRQLERLRKSLAAPQRQEVSPPATKKRFVIVPKSQTASKSVRPIRRVRQAKGDEDGAVFSTLCTDAFLRRPELDGPVKKGRLMRREARGQSKPRGYACMR